MSTGASMEKFFPTAEQIERVGVKHGLGVVSEWRTLSGGSVNPIVLLESECGRVVLKINTRDPALPKVRAEAWALNHVSSALTAAGGSFRVPRAIAWDTDRTDLPFDYLLMEFLAGGSGAAAWDDADDATRVALSRQMGEMARELHALSVPGTRYGGWDKEQACLGRRDDWSAGVAGDAAVAVAEARERSVVEPAMLAQVERWLARHREVVPRTPERVLLHHDFAPWNMLAERSNGNGAWRFTALFDFEWAAVGPRASEFATILPNRHGLVDAPTFFDAYAGGGRLGDDFLRQVYYYQMVFHLQLALVFSRPWPGQSVEWSVRHVERASALLRGEPSWALASAGYGWPF